MPAPSFKELMEAKGVFKEKEVLSPHYLPENLLYRENEIKRIMVAVAPALKGSKPKNLFIYGKSGTGKTACAKHVIKKLEEEKNQGVKAIYMNCRNYNTRYQILQKTISEFDSDISKTGYAFALLYEKMLEKLEKGIQLILVLDEIDTVKDLNSLIYTLTRANDDLKKGSVSLIGISNKVNFTNKLDSRSKSSLCEEELVFKPYDAQQLKGILEQRIEKGFEKGVVEESALNLAAAIAARENGDARYALALLLRAGEFAETHERKSVTDKDVEHARRFAEEDKVMEIITSLPEHQRMVLYAIALLGETKYIKLVEEGGEKFYFSGEVYEKYCNQIKKIGKEPVSSRWYREYLNELESIGLITTIQSSKGVRGHTTLIKCSYEPTKIKRIIEKTLNE